jgi:hypothetical protein
VQIIKGSEAITVEHPIFLLFGQPGICKTSLAYSAKSPLLLDFDNGSHRAVNRRDTMVVRGWSDIEELMDNRGVLDPYESVIVDTVGRCLDMLTADIAVKEPKNAPGGNLSQRGFGSLKTRFRSWMSQMRLLGKDVILIAHDKEEKDGDLRIVRPDIIGGSYGEVMKIADFVGYISMNGKDRVLDFNPTDRWIGKNPAGWPQVVPHVVNAQTFLADLMTAGRQALGGISAESAKTLTVVEQWREKLATMTTPEALTDAVVDAVALGPTLKPQVSKLIVDRGKALGFTFDKKVKKFVAVETPAEATV